MAEQVENTPQEQVQSTPQEAVNPTEQTNPPTEDSVDISKVDPANLTPEQVKELQLGYLRNKDYTQKTQELAQQKKQPVNFAEVIQTPEFLQWAKDIGIIGKETTQQQQQEPEFLSAFTDEQKQALQYMFQTAIQPYVQSQNAMTLAQQDEKLKTSPVYGEGFTPELVSKMNNLQAEVMRHKGALYREEAFKILDYEQAIERTKKKYYELGKQEGIQGKQIRQQANLPQTTSNTNGVSIYNKTDSPREKLRKSLEDAEKKHGSLETTRPHYMGAR